MRRSKIVATCVAVAAIAGAFSAPASAHVLKVGPGQPLASGGPHGNIVFHCQAAAELREGDLPSGTAPGAIVLRDFQIANVGGPRGGVCEQVAAELGSF